MDSIIKESGEQLLQAAQNTFETLTFASVEIADVNGIEHPPLSNLLHSSIDITCMKSSSTYKMELVISTDYLRTLISAINPDLENPDTDVHIDLLGELINTLSGNFMLQIESLIGDFKLGLPVSQEGKNLSEHAIISGTYVVDDFHPIYLGIFKTM